jgi:hypothetical protein
MTYLFEKFVNSRKSERIGRIMGPHVMYCMLQIPVDSNKFCDLSLLTGHCSGRYRNVGGGSAARKTYCTGPWNPLKSHMGIQKLNFFESQKELA